VRDDASPLPFHSSALSLFAKERKESRRTNEKIYEGEKKIPRRTNNEKFYAFRVHTNTDA
jgi:hypothetical protein